MNQVTAETVSYGGGCVTVPGPGTHPPDPESFPRDCFAYSFAHLLSGLDLCIGLHCEPFNMYILFINKLSKWLNPVRLGKYVQIKYT